MADAWATFPFEFRGGLITNLSPLQQGTQAPGSARQLKNFEPSIEGGYSRMLGYDKYSNDTVPVAGAPLVSGGSQTGTTLVVSNISVTPVEGDTFTVAGVTGVYTIAVAGVSYSETTKIATLTLTTSLASSPTDLAVVTFANSSSLITGLAAWRDSVLALRDKTLYKTTGASYTRVSVPVYGIAVLVNGASQTGTTLNIDGVDIAPKIGDTFTVAGVAKAYTITAAVTVVSGATTLTIAPALASSPADNAAVTFISSDVSVNGKARHIKYRIGVTEKIAFATGLGYPFTFDDNTFQYVTGSADLENCSHLSWFKNQMCYAVGDKIVITAPFTDNDLNPANGSGVISVGANITGLQVFREALFIFSAQSIHQITGNTLADFILKSVTTDIGCVASDTIQEIGGDVMFLGPDGLRLLSATDRINDFNLGVVSKPIQKEMTNLISASSSFSSVVIRKKSQYRLLGYSQSISTQSALGVIGVQLEGNDTAGINWAETQGFKAYVADSSYYIQTETAVFAESTGYVYQMESGNSFDGGNILATFSTPFIHLTDPRLRKTFYKLQLYTEPQGSVTTAVNLKLDFDTSGSVQPETLSLSNDTGVVGFFGSPLATYGTIVYGSKLKKIFETQLVGSGFSMSLQFISNSQSPPFSLDTATVEYAVHDRR